MINYLSQGEKVDTRIIWEQIFEEDTEKFLDYYYNYYSIRKSNSIICKYKDKHNIISMLHLNPYKININNSLYNSNYIVAVATLEEHRKKGYMAQILNKALNDMFNNKEPFTFLRPASDKIYLPFGFRYIYNHDFLEIKNIKNFDLKDLSNLKILNQSNIELVFESVNNFDFEFIADFTNKVLQNKNLFCNRDEFYIRTLLEEVKSENGDIIKIYKKDNLEFIGYYVYWGDIVRAVFFNNKENFNKYTQLKETKPLVMARIINIFEYFKNFTATQNIELIINLSDKIIKENNGVMHLIINKENSNIFKIGEVENSNYYYRVDLVLDIADLTSLFFGYKSIQEFTDNLEIIQKFDKINFLSNIFIDEEV